MLCALAACGSNSATQSPSPVPQVTITPDGETLPEIGNDIITDILPDDRNDNNNGTVGNGDLTNGNGTNGNAENGNGTNGTGGTNDINGKNAGGGTKPQQSPNVNNNY